jgi:shikimate kinase
VTVVLIGPPAAGKSRVGRDLARRLNVPFIDTDRVIVEQHGPIARIFTEHGEAYFRGVERETVAAALATDAVDNPTAPAAAVVSVGGGAVLDPETQRDLAAASVVLLTVSPEAAAARIGGSTRPLVSGMDSWQRLVDERSPLYARLADYTIDTSTRSPGDLADELARWIKETRGTRERA